ncbi:ComEC/Rec2 family competence protein [Bradyrhizobium japonicum]|uniref:ComEC/Rec2 family competence protein n=1 Tax=Bradyrhizobium japonicum TaxID=375 RepID=UPI001BA9ADE9|nr:hypothetical protein [Bradyrhizobium japonicum]MBR0911492.1 hypothetical protein [Bradyrhizobium japonicum]
MFRLEALKAKHGDCLILQWGKSDAPQDRKVALIDGGPDTVYATWLKPRLKALAQELGRENFKLDLTMVSHIDDDHIQGILDFADDIENGDPPADIGVLWHNSLEGLLDHVIEDVPAVHSVTASLAGAPAGTTDKWYSKVLSSVPQGQMLHAFSQRHGIDHLRNDPYQPLVVLRDGVDDAAFSGLTLKVIGPNAEELDKLRTQWKEKRREDITAAYSDRSPYNLSSIVVMATFGGRTALLTGDARGDRIIEGLARRGMLDDDGKIHVNLLKLMHHGSRNNVDAAFFSTVTADVYVVSGDDVKFPNPHEQAMKWLAHARGDDDYKIYCTYDLPYMREIFGHRLVVPHDDASVVVDIEALEPTDG